MSKKEREIVYVCVRERESQTVCEKDRKTVCERERDTERLFVYERK